MRKVLILLWAILFFSCQNKAENTGKPEVNKELSQAETTQVFEWTNGMCTYSGTFLPSEVTKSILEKTSLLRLSGTQLSGDPTIFLPKLKEITYKDHEITAFLNDLKMEYESKEMHLKRKVVKTNYWKNLQTQRLKELQEEYDLKRKVIEAYSNPEILLKVSYTENCKYYAVSLANKDTVQLMKTWEKIIMQQKANNGSPDDIQNAFIQQKSSIQKWDYAKETILIFGWYNCMNEQRVQWENEEEIQTEFARLFVKIEQSCDG